MENDRVKCKFCKRGNVEKIKKIVSPHNNLKYTLYGCTTCKSRFFDDDEHKVDIDDIYNSYPQNKQYLNVAFKPSKYWNNQKKQIVRILGHYPSSVLDLGCRTGDFLMHFDSNITRDGVEITEEYASIAKSRGLNIYNSKLEDTKFDKKYEVISAFAILEHLVSPLEFLDNINDLLADNGILIILIPNHENLKTWIIDTFTKVRWLMYSPPEHLNLFSRSFLDGYLNKKGFVLVKRYWTSGGTFNPFSRIPGLRFLFKVFMFLYDESFFNKIPVFDHLYSTYVFRNSESK